MHLRGEEALERFRGLQQQIRDDFDAERSSPRHGGSGLRWTLVILALVVLGALAAVVLSV